MKTGTKILLGATLITILAGAIYYSQTKKEGSLVNNQETATSTTSTTSAPEGKKMAFIQLVQQEEGTYKCSVTQYLDGVETMGTVYLDKKLVRGELLADSDGKKMTVTFLMKEGFTYVWNSITPTQGFKIKSAPTDIPGTQAQTTGEIHASANVYLEKIGDYSCEAWVADASKFAVPTAITFSLMN